MRIMATPQAPNLPIPAVLESIHRADRTAENLLCQTCRPRLASIVARWFRDAHGLIVDEEDVTDDVLAIVCTRLRKGTFPVCRRERDFWHLTRAIARCIFVSHCRRRDRRKRGGKRVSVHTRLMLTAGVAVRSEPPLFEATEELREIVYRAQDRVLCRIELLLEAGCWAPLEIAKILNCSPRLVQRRLRKLRDLWRQRVVSDPRTPGRRPESFLGEPFDDFLARCRSPLPALPPPPPPGKSLPSDL